MRSPEGGPRRVALNVEGIPPDLRSFPAPEAPILVPVLRDRKIRSWPKFPTGGKADYIPVPEALTRSFQTDAHFAAYSAPVVDRRLALDALRTPEARSQIPEG